MSSTTHNHVELKAEHLPQRLTDLPLIGPAYKAMLGFQMSLSTGTIEHSTLELVKIRASQINSCAYCLSMHTRDALKAGERQDRLATLSAWRETGWFTPREQAALAWTEAVTNVAGHHISDDQFEAARKQFSEQEMIDLTMAIVAINSWNRINAALATPPEHFD